MEEAAALVEVKEELVGEEMVKKELVGELVEAHPQPPSNCSARRVHSRGRRQTRKLRQP